MRSATKKAKLKQELRSAGSSDAELGELTTIATSLGSLRTAAPKVSFFRNLSVVPVAMSIVVSLFLGALVVSYSQTSMPNSLLYPLQKASDHLAISVDPSYRGVIMMQRAQDVHRLVADHASSKTVLASLADYRSEAMAYKSNSTNYSVFEFCKTNLRQAEANATGSERQAIQSTLASLADA